MPKQSFEAKQFIANTLGYQCIGNKKRSEKDKQLSRLVAEDFVDHASKIRSGNAVKTQSHASKMDGIIATFSFVKKYLTLILIKK